MPRDTIVQFTPATVGNPRGGTRVRSIDPQSSGGTTVTQKADVVYEPGGAPGVLIHKEPDAAQDGGTHFFGNTKTAALGAADPSLLSEEVRRQLKVGEFAEPEAEIVVEAEAVETAEAVEAVEAVKEEETKS